MSHDRRTLSSFLGPACCFALASSATFGQSDIPQHPVVKENEARLNQLSSELEKSFVIGPTVADALGYRVVWQARLPAQTPLRAVRVGTLGIYVLDEKNVIARLRPSDGEILWRISVADEVDIFRGVTWAEVPVTTASTGRGPTVTMEPRAFLSTDTECFAIDPNSGTVVSRQRFKKLPGTEPLAVGADLVYGTIGNQVVWHNCVLGFEVHANSLDSKSRSRPIRAGGNVVAASERGMLLCMDAETAATRWIAHTLGGIVASPATGDGMIYVAATDQYLWAFDARTGQFRWRYFTQSPLTTPPYPVSGAVLQFVPDEGLVSLAANADGKVDGVVRWRNKEATGVPIGLIGGDILLWDASKRVAMVVDTERGSVRQRHELPQVDELFLATRGPFENDLFGLARDGRVVRLTPKRSASAYAPPMPSAAPTAMPASIPLSIPPKTDDTASAPKSST
ncbi:MAG: PQQ-binding-like beta-propeller repeat protein [Phycisphaerales bacterium]